MPIQVSIFVITDKALENIAEAFGLPIERDASGQPFFSLVGRTKVGLKKNGFSSASVSKVFKAGLKMMEDEYDRLDVVSGRILFGSFVKTERGIELRLIRNMDSTLKKYEFTMDISEDEMRQYIQRNPQ